MSTAITPPSTKEVVPVPSSPTLAPKQISRRKVLALAGAATFVLVGGGGVWRATDQGVFSTGAGTAYLPWDDWRTPNKGPLDLVRAAILAASPHNSQPWLFQVTETQIKLYADHRRAIGTVDPFLREMHIGLGCALENLELAAAAQGYTTQVTLLPDALDETLVARIALAPGSATISDLYPMIPRRHTDRYPYDTARGVPAATLDALGALGGDPAVRVFWFADADRHKQLGTLLVEAAQAFVLDPAQDGDTARWWRGTWQEIEQHHDGITLDAAGLPDLTRAVGKMLPSASQEQQDSTFLKNIAAQVATAGAFGVLAVHDAQDRKQQLGAGRVWQRMHLWATKEGLALQPLNQVVERAAREAVLGSTPYFGTALQAAMNDSARHALLAFRIGYSTHQELRSPRRGVNEVIKP